MSIFIEGKGPEGLRDTIDVEEVTHPWYRSCLNLFINPPYYAHV